MLDFCEGEQILDAGIDAAKILPGTLNRMRKGLGFIFINYNISCEISFTWEILEWWVWLYPLRLLIQITTFIHSKARASLL